MTSRPHASLSQLVPCISPVAPDVGEVLGATGEIHGGNRGKDARGWVALGGDSVEVEAWANAGTRQL